MESVLSRTGSGPVNSTFLPGSPKFSGPLRHTSVSTCKKLEFSPFLNPEVNNNRWRINRAVSEPQAIIRLRSTSSGSQTFPKILPEVEDESLPDQSFKFVEKCFNQMSCGSGDGFGYGGGGYNNNNSNNNSNSNNNEQKKIGAYYQKMLKSNPNDPLLLRNYSKFLHEVEGDAVKADEYYGRAILANPGDGELLSLYGKLIWDTQRDGERAQSYFNQAVLASPNDFMVMGSYAQFMWEADEDEEEEASGLKVSVRASQPLVAAF